jgi:hypothetical protein
MTKRQSGKGGYDREYLEALIEEATVDCYDEYEQATGLFTMIEDELELPFTTRVLGMEVAVVAIEQDDSGLGVVAVCERQGERQRLSLSDLPLPSSPPAGAQWIAAYRLWGRHGGSTGEEDQT